MGVSVNSVLLAGGVTRDPESKAVGQTTLCQLSMAMNRKFTSQGQQKEETTYCDIDVWGKQADACIQYVKKGSQILVEGRLHLQSWKDQQTGQQRSKLSVTAERVQFLSTPQGQGNNGPPAQPTAEPSATGGYPPAQPPPQGQPVVPGQGYPPDAPPMTPQQQGPPPYPQG